MSCIFSSRGKQQPFSENYDTSITLTTIDVFVQCHWCKCLDTAASAISADCDLGAVLALVVVIHDPKLLL